MHPFSKVLCATDLSPQADEAMRQAAAVAGLYSAKLVVFHAMPSPTASSPFFPQLALQQNEQFVALERRVLEALHQRVATVIGRGTHVEVVLGSGSAHSAIVQTAEKAGADLIVVGGEGPKGVARALLGAVAERVVRYAHAPVWVARAAGGAGPVIVGTDFSPPATAATELAVDYARRAQAKLMVVHGLSIEKLVPAPGPPVDQPAFPTWSMAEIQTMRDAARTKCAAVASSAGVEVEVVVNDEAPGRALPALASSSAARLICVGTAGHTGLARVLLGSVAEEIVRKAPCPVLVTRRS